MAIAFDQAGGRLHVGQTVRFSGYADDFDFGVGSIEFSLDDGVNWSAYACEGSRDDSGVHWTFDFAPKLAGRYRLQARAVGKNDVASPLVSTFAFTVLPAAQAGVPAVYGSFRLRAVDGGPLEGARLFRGDALAGISPEEAQFLTSQLQIRTIYDLRNAAELAASPEPAVQGVRCVSIAPHATASRKDASRRLVAGVIGEYGAPEERMRRNYRRYVSDYPTLSAALRSMAAEGAPALFHCVNGKDRTGVVAAVLERIAGHADDAIMRNYLAANTLNAADIAADEARFSAGMTHAEHDILMSFLEVRPSYLEAFFDEAEAQFGSFDAYLERGLHLTEAQLGTLRALMAR